MKTQPPPAAPTHAEVADAYAQALRDLRLEVVRQGELTRAAIARVADDVEDLAGRVEELEAMVLP